MKETWKVDCLTSSAGWESVILFYFLALSSYIFIHVLVSLQLVVITENNPSAGLFSRVNPELYIVFIFTLHTQHNTEGTCSVAHPQSCPQDEPWRVARWHCRTEISPVPFLVGRKSAAGGQKGALGWAPAPRGYLLLRLIWRSPHLLGVQPLWDSTSITSTAETRNDSRERVNILGKWAWQCLSPL